MAEQPLDSVYPVIFLDALVCKVRTSRPQPVRAVATSARSASLGAGRPGSRRSRRRRASFSILTNCLFDSRSQGFSRRAQRHLLPVDSNGGSPNRTSRGRPSGAAGPNSTPPAPPGRPRSPRRSAR